MAGNPQGPVLSCLLRGKRRGCAWWWGVCGGRGLVALWGCEAITRRIHAQCGLGWPSVANRAVSVGRYVNGAYEPLPFATSPGAKRGAWRYGVSRGARGGQAPAKGVRSEGWGMETEGARASRLGGGKQGAVRQYHCPCELSCIYLTG
ncbi:MAG: hypothetical protein H6Q73_3766 [Firmicutes bacterium]|nr:hypothetical protein [Bacillota bacterium]